MNKRIFGGRCLESNRWVYGDYELGLRSGVIVDENGCKVPVDINTVGIYTGKCDSNMVRIFEKDIVRHVKGREGFIKRDRNSNFTVKLFDNGEEVALDFLDSQKLTVVGNLYGRGIS